MEETRKRANQKSGAVLFETKNKRTEATEMKKRDGNLVDALHYVVFTHNEIYEVLHFHRCKCVHKCQWAPTHMQTEQKPMVYVL